MMYHEVFENDKNIIGMVHLLPLPGHAYHTNMQAVTDAALYDAEALLKGGVTHAIIENDGDRPFGISNLRYDFGRTHTSMADVGRVVHVRFPELNLGVQVLNNYSQTPGILNAIGGTFLRSQFYCEARIDPDERIIMPNCVELCRSNEGCDFVILADINSKGSRPLESEYDPEESVKRIVDSEFMPDGLITTGAQTGVAPSREQVSEFMLIVHRHDPGMPIGVGSGVTPKAITDGLLDNAGFAVVGSCFKTDGKVDSEKVEKLMLTLEETYS
ncbi:MAG: hypothetical protein ISS36_03910 [Candidatus Aenigmarchaeota archaeon]|nr:hypothetical protein [Candidatus Aenigmarchaeota archaeon]